MMFLVSLRLLKTHHKLALWRVQVYGLNKPLVNKAKQKCHSNSANACPMRWVWCGDRNCLSLTKGRNICSFAYEFDLKSFDLSLGTFHKISASGSYLSNNVFRDNMLPGSVFRRNWIELFCETFLSDLILNWSELRCMKHRKWLEVCFIKYSRKLKYVFLAHFNPGK